MTEFLLAVLIRSAFLGAVGLAALWIVRRRSASVRHAVAMAAVVSMLALPFLGFGLPSRTVEALPPAVSLQVVTLVTSPALAAERTRLPAPQLTAEASPTRVNWKLVGWLSGSVVLLVRLIWGLGLLIRRMRRAEAMGSEHGVEIRVDSEARVPMTAWWGKHVVLLPPAWLEWPADQVEAVLRHERAHIQRGDWFVRVVAHIACVVLWPNPFVWLLARWARDLAESAADDLVLLSGVAPSRYAATLLEIAREAKAAVPALALPMAEKAEVARRIEMVLNKNRARGAVSLAGVVTLGLAVAALSVPFATWAARPVQAPSKPTGASNADVYTLKTDVYRVAAPPQTLTGETIKLQPRKGGKVVVVTMTEEQYQAYAKQLKTSKPAASPTVVTRVGQASTLVLDGLPGGTMDSITFYVSPEALPDGRTRYHVRFGESKKGRSKPTTVDTGNVDLKSGGRIVILPGKQKGENVELVLVVTPTKEAKKPSP